MALPNFIGIGAPRSGSTWLDHQLRAHAEVYLPTKRKELMFFDRHFERGMPWYESCFAFDDPHAFKAIGEISPRYFADPAVPRRIRDHLDQCRFLLVLRNPVDRAYSEYKYMVQAYNERRDFLGFLENNPKVVDDSMYDLHLRRWLDLFSYDRFLILDFDRVMSRPEQAFDRLASFLEIDRGRFGRVAGTEPVNPSFLPRWRPVYTVTKRISRFLHHRNLDWVVDSVVRAGAKKLFVSGSCLPPLDDAVRAQIAPSFADSIERLEDIIRFDLASWKT